MASKPITLNARDVALAAKKAFDRKRLSAQGPMPDCRYRDDEGRPCAIGAAVSAKVARRMDDGVGGWGESRITALIRAGMVATDQPLALKRLQEAHDNWVHEESPEAERKFIRVLNNILRKTAEA